MGSRYEMLKKLIDLWETYEDESEQLNLLDFSDWLTIQMKQNPELNKKILYKKVKTNQPEQDLFIKNMDEPARFLEYISRISRYHEFYLRKFFVDLPINNRLEFLFLHTVEQEGQAKKTDLINIHLVEYSTGMDTIKRLINNGLLKENQDENDKRVKLLEITEKGKSILMLAIKKVSEEKNMFLACISMNKWKKTMPALEAINEFHNSIYLNHNDKPYAELLNLMDSLKHLYK